MSYLKKYPLSLLVLCIILFLSFFNPPETPLGTVTNIDKVLHFLMYFGLCSVIWFEYYRSHQHPSVVRLMIGSVLAPILFSGLVEIGQQTLTPTRAAEWWDFLFNTLGCLTAALCGAPVIKRIAQRFRQKNHSS